MLQSLKRMLVCRVWRCVAFSVSVLLVGHDEHGPQLYQIDPSGAYCMEKHSQWEEHDQCQDLPGAAV